MTNREVDSTVIHRQWSEIIDTVIAGDDVAITRYGRPIVVIVKADKWNRKLPFVDGMTNYGLEDNKTFTKKI